MNAPDTGADVGHAIDAAKGRDAPGQTRLRQLADERAALRRVATLVARGAPTDELFAAVPQEAGAAASGRPDDDDPLRVRRYVDRRRRLEKDRRARPARRRPAAARG